MISIPKKMRVSIPKKMRVDTKSNLEDCNKIQELFNRHGFGISHFGPRGVVFYDKKYRVKNSVPIDSIFNMNKKEFIIFVNIMNRLDESKKKMSEYIKFVSKL